MSVLIKMFVFSIKGFWLLGAAALLLSGDRGLPLAQALNCWECNATVIENPVLEHQCNVEKIGVSAECPGPNGVCRIEMRTTNDPPATIIGRDCVDEAKPHLGKCVVTTEDKVGKIETCHCNTDNCNEGLIDGKGDGKGGDKKNGGDSMGGKLFGVVSMMMIFIVFN